MEWGKITCSEGDPCTVNGTLVHQCMAKWNHFGASDSINTRFRKILGVNAYPTMKSVEPFPLGHVVTDLVNVPNGPTAVMHFYTQHAGGGFMGNNAYRERSAALARALMFVSDQARDGILAKTTFWFVTHSQGHWHPAYTMWDDFVHLLEMFARRLPEGFDVRIIIPTKK